MPRNPCCARVPASGTRTFPPRSGGKVSAFFRLSEKFRNFSDSLKGQVPDLSLFSYNIKAFVNAVQGRTLCARCFCPNSAVGTGILTSPLSHSPRKVPRGAHWGGWGGASITAASSEPLSQLKLAMNCRATRGVRPAWRISHSMALAWRTSRFISTWYSPARWSMRARYSDLLMVM